VIDPKFPNRGTLDKDHLGLKVKKIITKVKQPAYRQRQAKMADLCFAFDKLNSELPKNLLTPKNERW